MKAIDKKKKALKKSQSSLLEVLDIPMVSKIKEEEEVKKRNEEITKRYGNRYRRKITGIRRQKV